MTQDRLEVVCKMRRYPNDLEVDCRSRHNREIKHTSLVVRTSMVESALGCNPQSPVQSQTGLMF